MGAPRRRRRGRRHGFGRRHRLRCVGPDGRQRRRRALSPGERRSRADHGERAGDRHAQPGDDGAGRLAALGPDRRDPRRLQQPGEGGPGAGPALFRADQGAARRRPGRSRAGPRPTSPCGAPRSSARRRPAQRAEAAVQDMLAQRDRSGAQLADARRNLDRQQELFDAPGRLARRRSTPPGPRPRCRRPPSPPPRRRSPPPAPS